MEDLEKLKEEYLLKNEIKFIGRKPKKTTFKTQDILTIYSTHTITKVL